MVASQPGGNRVARRNDHSPEELRILALAAARGLAIEEGMRGVTVRRVAERIGYAPGTIYNLFANLDDLIVHVNGDTLAGLEAALRQEADGDLSTRPRRLTDAYFDFVEAVPRLWAMIFEHRLPEQAALPPWYHQRLDSVIELVAAALAPAMTTLPTEERRRAVIAMWAALHGIATLAVSRKLGLVADLSARELGYFVVSRILARDRAGG